MSPNLQTVLNRRRFQQFGIAAVGALAASGFPASGVQEGYAATPEATPPANLPPTPACGDGDDDELTLAQTEGPYFTRNSPERTSLIEEGMSGEHLIVTGYVYSTECKPVDKALLDFWHCDDSGVYDNVGYRLRGHLFTDEDGLFQLETIKPGLYTGRTRHIHVKVQAPDGPVLTTQLYFPDEPENERDGIFNSALLMEMVEPTDDDPLTGFFDFIVEPVS
jgi:protocatechuate 3,4-dioxygenase beta subunit